MDAITKFAGESERGGISYNLWAGCPLAQMTHDNNAGVLFRDDFTHMYATGSRYTLREADSTVVISQIATDARGVLRLAIDNTDNNEANLSVFEGGMVKFTSGYGRMWYECKFRTSSVADNANGIYIGLAEEASNGADLQADNTGLMSNTKDYVAFRCLQADGDGLDIVYNTASGTETVHKEIAQALSADTWYKIGLYYDGLNKVKFYVNGVQVGDDLLITASNFPDGEEMHLFAAAKTGTTTAFNLDIDWWQLAQERTA